MFVFQHLLSVWLRNIFLGCDFRLFPKRSDAIQADIDAGNLARKEGESFKEQYETQMANARSDAHEILESAKRSASAEKKIFLHRHVKKRIA